ncbi:quinone oxidoreductase family protein [Algiphilus sp.]|uniref:quinone oxidoreductase family protein n=1 Tax=Algiphilus sp. TaxID=1872431 RepID=UPI003C3FDAB6
MPKQCQFDGPGGPEVIRWSDAPEPVPGEGEVAIAHTAVGVNYIDVYHRSGLYPVPLPSGLGMEAVGTVTAVGAGVAGLAPGDRVAYASAPLGAYAEARAMPADRVVRVPDALDDRTAAAIMLKGLTAHALLFRVFPVRAGHHVLVHAAAGGAGSLLCAWAHHLGARVIGTVGSAAKAERALATGCDAVVRYDREPVAETVRGLTDGRGVDVVYDGVGAATFEASLDALAPLGMMVSFGNASGAVPAFAPGELARRGSLFLTRPSVIDYTRSRADLETGAAAVFEAVAAGVLRPHIGQTYALTDAARAHHDLEDRRTVGASLLLPA